MGKIHYVRGSKENDEQIDKETERIGRFVISFADFIVSHKILSVILTIIISYSIGFSRLYNTALEMNLLSKIGFPAIAELHFTRLFAGGAAFFLFFILVYFGGSLALAFWAYAIRGYSKK